MARGGPAADPPGQIWDKVAAHPDLSRVRLTSSPASTFRAPGVPSTVNTHRRLRTLDLTYVAGAEADAIGKVFLCPPLRVPKPSNVRRHCLLQIGHGAWGASSRGSLTFFRRRRSGSPAATMAMGACLEVQIERAFDRARNDRRSAARRTMVDSLP
jgi:hypothetical protein